MYDELWKICKAMIHIPRSHPCLRRLRKTTENIQDILFQARILLSDIPGSHVGKYEDDSLLGYCAV
jgi:hypothetical protein